MEAVAQGYNVYFLTVAELLDQLSREVRDNRLSERLTKLRMPTIQTLDEMVYIPLEQTPTSFRFQLVSKRYIRDNIIPTSNTSCGESGSVFGVEGAAAAVIDRLLRYSTTVNIGGDTYRLTDRCRFGVLTLPDAKPAC